MSQGHVLWSHPMFAASAVMKGIKVYQDICYAMIDFLTRHGVCVMEDDLTRFLVSKAFRMS